ERRTKRAPRSTRLACRAARRRRSHHDRVRHEQAHRARDPPEARRGHRGAVAEAASGRRAPSAPRRRVPRGRHPRRLLGGEREARTLATLDHPRVPRYFDHFEEDGALWLVMELVDGESLASLRKAGRAFGVAEVSRMLEDASSALSYLHARTPPVIHRDVKP